MTRFLRLLSRRKGSSPRVPRVLRDALGPACPPEDIFALLDTAETRHVPVDAKIADQIAPEGALLLVLAGCLVIEHERHLVAHVVAGRFVGARRALTGTGACRRATAVATATCLVWPGPALRDLLLARPLLAAALGRATGHRPHTPPLSQPAPSSRVLRR